MAPAAPASDCISVTWTGWPNMFFCPRDAHSSTSSAIGDDGVIGKIAATSVNAYDAYAAAWLPSIVDIFIRKHSFAGVLSNIRIISKSAANDVYLLHLCRRLYPGFV